MEETDVCHLTAAFWALQQAIPPCPAKALPPSDRLHLGLHALAGTQTITALAEEFDVSRKFVYRQTAIANQALDDAFSAKAPDDAVLFHLPVTKQWLRQLTLGLVLICHSPLRGVVELLRDLFDYRISLGTVFNTIQAAIATAREHNQAQDLSRIQVGAHDEIFQARQPVLVGTDALTSYCYLLSREQARDADSWGIRLLELQERGFKPDYVVADAALALRAAQAEVLPDIPCRSDVFHALKEVHEVVTYLDNRAYEAINACAHLEIKKARTTWHHGRPDPCYVRQLVDATKKQAKAVQLADDMALLARWLRFDVLGLAGPSHADRLALYDFLLAELESRIPQAPKLLGRLATYLKRQRDDLLAFAAQLDHGFAELTARFAVSEDLVRQLFAVQTLPLKSERRWHRDAPLRRVLADRYWPLSQALDRLRRRTVRASSLVENLNSRLRSYFFLRRHLGNDYLALLQFFLNHRRFLRSEHPERRNKSPTELLTGQSHPHWLQLLGHQQFSRN